MGYNNGYMKNNTKFIIAGVICVLIVIFALTRNTNNTNNSNATIPTPIIPVVPVDDTSSVVVNTGNKDVPKIVVTPELKKESKSYLGRDGVYVVQYTNNGFVPQQLQIPRGKSVRFINMSDRGLRVFSDNSSDSKFFELNQSKTIGKGSTYTFSFVIDGLWSYHNETYPSDKANIAVY